MDGWVDGQMGGWNESLVLVKGRTGVKGKLEVSGNSSWRT